MSEDLRFNPQFKGVEPEVFVYLRHVYLRRVYLRHVYLRRVYLRHVYLHHVLALPLESAYGLGLR